MRFLRRILHCLTSQLGTARTWFRDNCIRDACRSSFYQYRDTDFFRTYFLRTNHYMATVPRRCRRYFLTGFQYVSSFHYSDDYRSSGYGDVFLKFHCHGEPPADVSVSRHPRRELHRRCKTVCRMCGRRIGWGRRWISHSHGSRYEQRQRKQFRECQFLPSRMKKYHHEFGDSR